MNTRISITAILLLIASLLITSCGPGQLFGPTPTPTLTITPTLPPTPTLTPTPIAGIGVPVSDERWQITLLEAYQEETLSGPINEYSPNKSDQVFLVVNTELRYVGKTSELEGIKCSTNDFNIINDENGDVLFADIIGFGDSMWAAIGDPLVFLPAAFQGDGVNKFEFATVVEKKFINNVFKLRFKDLPPIPFSAKEKR
jgi:hypothetical protein